MNQSFHIKILILTLVLLGGGLFSYSLIKNGIFPVARVNGRTLTYKAVAENIDVSQRLYSAGLAGADAELDKLFSRSNRRELLKGALENLITGVIVRTAVDDKVIKRAVQEINSSLENKNITNLADSLKAVYGWDIDKFKERVLEPQTLLAVLAKDKGDNFESWLTETKTAAKVSIWFLPFRWENGGVKDK